MLTQGARQLGLIDSVPSLDTFIVDSSADSSSEDIPPVIPPPRTESPKAGASRKEEEVLVTNSEVGQSQLNSCWKSRMFQSKLLLLLLVKTSQQ
jgi:hypothetical protein